MNKDTVFVIVTFLLLLLIVIFTAIKQAEGLERKPTSIVYFHFKDIKPTVPKGKKVIQDVNGYRNREYFYDVNGCLKFSRHDIGCASHEWSEKNE